MSKGKVLFIDTAHQKLKPMLENLGFECDYYESFLRADFLSVAANYVGIIIRSKIKIDKEFIDQSSKLKFIGRVGAGMENIDVEYAENKGIICLNAPEGNRDAVAEHAIGMLLALFNKLLIADTQVRKGVWEREGNRGLEIGGKTIGIIGYGNTGSAFARKLSGFGAKVIAYDKYKTNFSDDFAEECSLDTIFADSDIVSLHVPLTSETMYMANEDFFNSFSKNIYLINTSRGKVLKTRDLLTALQNGKVTGACLDVLEYEGLSFETLDIPDEFTTLVALDNIVLSPHIAGWTHDSNLKMAMVLAEKISSLDI